MIYAYDTEFLEDGRTIELISIGIVAADGREYYAVNADAPWGRIKKDKWLRDNVLHSLPGQMGREVVRRNGYTVERSGFQLDTKDVRVKPHWVIANEVRDFLLADGVPELWADYAAYDHVVLCQLWGRMIDLPPGLPMWTRDLQHEAASHRLHIPEQPSGAHNALEDARHVMSVLREEWGYVR